MSLDDAKGSASKRAWQRRVCSWKSSTRQAGPLRSAQCTSNSCLLTGCLLLHRISKVAYSHVVRRGRLDPICFVFGYRRGDAPTEALPIATMGVSAGAGLHSAALGGAGITRCRARAASQREAALLRAKACRGAKIDARVDVRRASEEPEARSRKPAARAAGAVETRTGDASAALRRRSSVRTKLDE